MSANPFRDRLAQLPTPAQRTDIPAITYGPHVVNQPFALLITERQHDYASDLLDQRDLTAEGRPAWRNRLMELRTDLYNTSGSMLWQLTRDQASALIDCLKDLPVRDRAPLSPAQQEAHAQIPSAEVDVPAGRYAIEAADGTLMFVKVDRPIEGKWAGRTFVSRQLSDELVRLPRDHQAAILDTIRADGPRNAAIRYGHELGKCSACDRTLTNAESRELGIGPICAGKLGW